MLKPGAAAWVLVSLTNYGTRHVTGLGAQASVTSFPPTLEPWQVLQLFVVGDFWTCSCHARGALSGGKMSGESNDEVKQRSEGVRGRGAVVSPLVMRKPHPVSWCQSLEP